MAGKFYNCPECKSDNIRMDCGCSTCHDCGWSACPVAQTYITNNHIFLFMITDNNPIHYIKSMKRLVKLMIKQYNEYYNTKWYLGYDKKRNKYIVKKYRK